MNIEMSFLSHAHVYVYMRLNGFHLLVRRWCHQTTSILVNYFYPVIPATLKIYNNRPWANLVLCFCIIKKKFTSRGNIDAGLSFAARYGLGHGRSVCIFLFWIHVFAPPNCIYYDKLCFCFPFTKSIFLMLDFSPCIYYDKQRHFSMLSLFWECLHVKWWQRTVVKDMNGKA